MASRAGGFLGRTAYGPLAFTVPAVQAPVYGCTAISLRTLKLNQRAAKILSECWLTDCKQNSVLENLDQLLCRPTDSSEPLANDLGIV